MPMSGGWTRITLGLKQLVIGIRPFSPFTYRGLVEFLTMTEDILESLGDDQTICQETAHQLIYDVLVEAAEHLDLPTPLL